MLTIYPILCVYSTAKATGVVLGVDEETLAKRAKRFGL